MKRTVVVVSLTAAVALLAAGCMSDSSSDRGARKAALGSTTSGEPIGSMDIAGVAWSGSRQYVGNGASGVGVRLLAELSALRR